MFSHYRSLILAYPRVISLGLFAAFLSNSGQTFFIGLYGEHFRAFYGLSNSAFGSIYSVVTLCSGLCLLRFGKLIDTIPLPIYSAFACMLLALGCVIIGMQPIFPFFVMGLFLVRFIGQGVMSHMGSTVAARYVPGARGKAISLCGMGFPLGNVILPFIIAWLLSQYAWYQNWFIYAACYLLIALPVMVWLARLKPEDDVQLTKTLDTNNRDADFSAVRRDPIFWFILVVALWMPFFMTGLLFHQQIIMHYLAISMTDFAIALSIFGMASIIANIVGGHLVDQKGNLWMLQRFLWPVIIGMAVVSFWVSPVSIWIMMALAALSAGSGFSAHGSFIAQRYGTTHLGAIKSVMSGAMVLSTAISPAFFGFVIDQLHSVECILYAGWIMPLLLVAALMKMRA